MNPPIEPDLLTIVLDLCGEITGGSLGPDDGSPDKGFVHLGVDSVSVFRLQMELEERLKLSLPDTFLLDHPTPRQTAVELARRLGDTRF